MCAENGVVTVEDEGVGISPVDLPQTEPQIEVVSTLSAVGPPSRPELNLPTLDGEPIELPVEAPRYEIARATVSSVATPDLGSPDVAAPIDEDSPASTSVALHRVAPEYPIRARIAGQTGWNSERSRSRDARRRTHRPSRGNRCAARERILRHSQPGTVQRRSLAAKSG